MRRWIVRFALLAAVGIGGAIGGYLLRDMRMTTDAPGGVAPAASERRVAYYKDPSGKPDYAPGPKKDAEGRDFVPVFEDEESGGAATPARSDAPGGKSRQQIRNYRNPMGLPDTSPVPKKDWMGMDYIPVYEGDEAEDPNVVKVGIERVQRLGVRTETVERRNLMRPIRAVGSVQFNERRVAVVSTRFEGWIEKLMASATGEPVRRGQPLLQVYSPDLLLAQQEYVAVRQMTKSHGRESAEHAPVEALAAGALQRLRNLGMPADELRRLERGGAPARLVTVASPFDGVIVEKMALAGARFMPGELLYRIADNSDMWLIAEVFEQDLANVRLGETADIVVQAYPDQTFSGRVGFIYPTVGRETRTVKVRIEVANPDGALKAEMYASVVIGAPVGGAQAIAVADSAVIEGGARRIVLIDRGEGRFEPREVRLGAKADGYYEVLEGLAGGERVVVAANFLIDAESNLKAALRAFTAPENAK